MQRKNAIIKKAFSLSIKDYCQITEAIIFLLISNFLIFCLPLRWWHTWIGQKNAGMDFEQYPMHKQEKIRQLRHNLRRANKLLFNPSKCFALSLSLKKMLSLRGIPSTLYLGVAKGQEQNLKAHAWLKCRDEIVYGGKHVDHNYQQLISFSKK